jgi:hypothetical protein
MVDSYIRPETEVKPGSNLGSNPILFSVTLSRVPGTPSLRRQWPVLWVPYPERRKGGYGKLCGEPGLRAGWWPIQAKTGLEWDTSPGVSSAVPTGLRLLRSTYPALKRWARFGASLRDALGGRVTQRPQDSQRRRGGTEEPGLSLKPKAGLRGASAPPAPAGARLRGGAPSGSGWGGEGEGRRRRSG